MNTTATGLCCLLAFLGAGGPAAAAGTAGQPAVAAVGAVKLAADLAMVVENPLARIVNLQFNGNVNFEKGADQRTQSVAIGSATYPFDLPHRWNLFASTSLPLIDQPVGPTNRVRGWGDTTVFAFLSPPSNRRWVFGAGPVFVLPTATDDRLGQGKWDVGPAVAVVRTDRAWVAGMVVSQSWSISGANDRAEVSRLQVSPFGTWHLGQGWYLFSAPTLSRDWYVKSGRAWTVPLGGGVGHIVRRGKHAVNIAIQAYANVVRPEGAPSWQLRLTTGWVFPK